MKRTGYVCLGTLLNNVKTPQISNNMNITCFLPLNVRSLERLKSTHLLISNGTILSASTLTQNTKISVGFLLWPSRADASLVAAATCAWICIYMVRSPFQYPVHWKRPRRGVSSWSYITITLYRNVRLDFSGCGEAAVRRRQDGRLSILKHLWQTQASVKCRSIGTCCKGQY